jgi:hypothetical protein
MGMDRVRITETFKSEHNDKMLRFHRWRVQIFRFHVRFEEGLDMEHALATKLDLVNLIPPVLDGP